MKMSCPNKLDTKEISIPNLSHSYTSNTILKRKSDWNGLNLHCFSIPNLDWNLYFLFVVMMFVCL